MRSHSLIEHSIAVANFRLLIIHNDALYPLVLHTVRMAQYAFHITYHLSGIINYLILYIKLHLPRIFPNSVRPSRYDWLSTSRSRFPRIREMQTGSTNEVFTINLIHFPFGTCRSGRVTLGTDRELANWTQSHQSQFVRPYYQLKLINQLLSIGDFRCVM